ncbi:hypothetical protein QFC20_003140 [Naganishia adeliensis]|uniref:Uncharacterized protein n=1 Tax=Naganishia adeliensis TaxID=92952 RepID=A0ACC2WF34_9TREE|nr:hypothetical protein QFC20_003140 [Naganishia adeliensis]
MTTLLTLHIPPVDSQAFDDVVNDYFAQAQALIDSLPSWRKKSTHHGHTVQSYVLPKGSAESSEARIRSSMKLDPNEYWVGRTSTHQLDNAKDATVYERFRAGLLVDHSEQERQYIESCIESERLQVFREQEAEVWRMTYKTPPPTSPRTFVFLLLCRELQVTPGTRSFMNISIPFDHPSVQVNQGTEQSRVRGRYVSVEYVKEVEGGSKVEWLMATSSCAAGSIPQFLTNWSLPGKVTEDVPSFVQYVNDKIKDDAPASTASLGRVTTLTLEGRGRYADIQDGFQDAPQGTERQRI